MSYANDTAAATAGSSSRPNRLNGRNIEWGLLAAAVGAGALLLGTSLLRERRRLDPRGKVALVTGGSRGLGLILARRLCAMGARVAICARDVEELALAQDTLRQETGCEVLAVPCDVTDPDAVKTLIQAVENKLGPIDILINNAATIVVGPMETMTEEDYVEAMDINFWGPFHTIHAVLPSMRSRKTGRIVNVASIGGKLAIPHLLPYSSSKFALVGFSEGLRAELRKDGILVTTACPGLIRTGSARNALFKGQNEKEYAWFSLGDSLPGISQSADQCAAEILNGMLHGDAEVIPSITAKVAALAHGIAPGATSDSMALANHFLPEAGGIGTDTRRGYESETAVTRSPLTALSQRAEVDNNQLAAAALPAAS